MSVLLLGQAQKLKINETDKFTGAKIMQTSYEIMYRHAMALNPSHRFEVSTKKVSSDSSETYALHVRILLPSIEKYDDNSYVMFLFEGGVSVQLYPNYTGVSGTKYGDGYYFETSFTIPTEFVELFKTKKISDIRVSPLKHVYDFEIDPKKQDLLINEINLLQ